ncbi:hypothetical protein E5K00_18550 [Hymenobacter aquaticus]|uniref:Uncharacterized protein n=1 Tax=Hymenobacter aquaticus TaxID=1867101 RepID=A0A4Z0PWT9_9BACT|nr:hypothetical protein [Hymenobacter aquaticus]TGE22248.1 hypothetical protein E5K00_18550 [Hymenobacter aquaticus]
MEHGTPEVRLFTGSDVAMRSRMRTMHGHYLTDAAAFAALNPDLGGSFGATWLAAIEAADKAPNVDVRRGTLSEDTATVESEMERARSMAQSVFYYVDQAFPRNKARLTQYGKERYGKAAADPEEMRLLLDMAAQAAERDHAALAEKGFRPQQLADLKALAAQLDTVDTQHELRKGTNQEDTNAYIRLQNQAYSFGQQLNKAAKRAFEADPTKQKRYRLSDGEAPAGGPGPKTSPPAK